MGKKEEIKRTKDRSRLEIEADYLIEAVKEVLNRHRRLLWRKDDIDLISKEICSVWLNYVLKRFGNTFTYQCECGKVQLPHKENRLLHVCKECGTSAVYKIKTKKENK